MNSNELKALLDTYYRKYKNKYSSKDPVWHLHNCLQNSGNKREAELLGFIVSCYSYGQVDLINRFISRFLKNINNNLFQFTVNFSKRKDKKYLKDLNYRFNDAQDMVYLIEALQHNIITHGSLYKLFKKGYSSKDENIMPALAHFTRNLKSKLPDDAIFNHFIPNPQNKSACKRLNLYLRWMVRSDNIDLGLWKGIDKSKLIFPVDIHIYRIAFRLGLVSRKSPDLKFAIELTEKMKEFDPLDPVKYDFALCHMGIDKVNYQSSIIND